MDEWMSHMAGQPPEEELDDDNEDFYGYDENGNGEVKAGAGAMHIDNVNGPVCDHSKKESVKVEQATKSIEERKAENQRKADMLRAKLIAQRQNTPRQSTPKKIVPSSDSPPRAPVVLQQDTGKGEAEDRRPDTGPSGDALGLESLFAEGRAAAEAKNLGSHGRSTADESHSERTFGEQGFGNPEHVAQPTNIEQTEQRAKPATIDTDNSNKRTTQLTDPYYADLSAWLDMTGFHDLDYRHSKMRVYKERRALEQEAAAIAQRLEQLRETEQAEIAQLRASFGHAVGAEQVNAPPLPSTMLSEDAAVIAAIARNIRNGVKRPHSPVPMATSNKRLGSSSGGFKIRGATNDSPEVRTYRGQSPPLTDRRTSYAGGRRMSRDEPLSRDPSLERRQAYYRRDDDDVDSGYRRDDQGPRYAQYPPRELHNSHRSMNHRAGNAVHGNIGRPGGYRSFDQGRRESVGSDPRKVGQAFTRRP